MHAHFYRFFEECLEAVRVPTGDDGAERAEHLLQVLLRDPLAREGVLVGGPDGGAQRGHELLLAVRVALTQEFAGDDEERALHFVSHGDGMAQTGAHARCERKWGEERTRLTIRRASALRSGGVGDGLAGGREVGRADVEGAATEGLEVVVEESEGDTEAEEVRVERVAGLPTGDERFVEAADEGLHLETDRALVTPAELLPERLLGAAEAERVEGGHEELVVATIEAPVHAANAGSEVLVPVDGDPAGVEDVAVAPSCEAAPTEVDQGGAGSQHLVEVEPEQRLAACLRVGDRLALALVDHADVHAEARRLQGGGPMTQGLRVRALVPVSGREPGSLPPELPRGQHVEEGGRDHVTELAEVGPIEQALEHVRSLGWVALL